MKRDICNEEDIVLLSALRRDNRKAFDSLFKKYYASLCAYAYRYVEFGDAEEIVQDVLLWLWENRSSFILKVSLSSYLFRAVHCRSLTCIEQNMAKKRAEVRYWEQFKDETPSNLDDFQVKELILQIHQYIEHLPEEYKESFILHRFKGMSYKEIAAKLDVSSKTVDYRIQQALKILRKNLKEYQLVLLCFFS